MAAVGDVLEAETLLLIAFLGWSGEQRVCCCRESHDSLLCWSILGLQTCLAHSCARRSSKQWNKALHPHSCLSVYVTHTHHIPSLPAQCFWMGELTTSDNLARFWTANLGIVVFFFREARTRAGCSRRQYGRVIWYSKRVHAPRCLPAPVPTSFSSYQQYDAHRILKIGEWLMSRWDRADLTDWQHFSQ